MKKIKSIVLTMALLGLLVGEIHLSIRIDHTQNAIMGLANETGQILSEFANYIESALNKGAR
jgi:hypothetical protein